MGSGRLWQSETVSQERWRKHSHSLLRGALQLPPHVLWADNDAWNEQSTKNRRTNSGYYFTWPSYVPPFSNSILVLRKTELSMHAVILGKAQNVILIAWFIILKYVHFVFKRKIKNLGMSTCKKISPSHFCRGISVSKVVSCLTPWTTFNNNPTHYQQNLS